MTNTDIILTEKLQELSHTLSFFEDHPLNHLYAYTVSKSYHETVQTGLAIQTAVLENNSRTKRQPWIDQARHLSELCKQLFTGESSTVYWHAYQAKTHHDIHVSVTSRDAFDQVLHGILVPHHKNWLVMW